MANEISIVKCPCGASNCSDYHLEGIGKFCQGSGFTLEEAEEIVVALRVKELSASLLKEALTELHSVREQLKHARYLLKELTSKESSHEHDTL